MCDKKMITARTTTIAEAGNILEACFTDNLRPDVYPSLQAQYLEWHAYGHLQPVVHHGSKYGSLSESSALLAHENKFTKLNNFAKHHRRNDRVELDQSVRVQHLKTLDHRL